MAGRWNIFSGKAAGREKSGKSVHTTGESALTERDIRAMVNQEVNAASVKKQVINYMEDVSAQGVRTEALLSEIKNVVDYSLYRIEEISNKADVAPERMDELESSIKQIGNIGEELKASVHKDNLLTYKNIKQLIDGTDDKNEGRTGALKKGVTAAVIMSSVTLGIVVMLAVFIALCYFKVI